MFDGLNNFLFISVFYNKEIVMKYLLLNFHFLQKIILHSSVLYLRFYLNPPYGYYSPFQVSFRCFFLLNLIPSVLQGAPFHVEFLPCNMWSSISIEKEFIYSRKLPRLQFFYSMLYVIYIANTALINMKNYFFACFWMKTQHLSKERKIIKYLYRNKFSK